jgi:signal transduction histidine kinase
MHTTCENKTRQLDVLLEMAALINSTLDQREVRMRAIESAMRLVDAEGASLLLIDDEKLELFFEVALGTKGETLKEVRLKRGEGIAGWVAEHGVAQLVSDTRSDARFFSQIDELCGFITRDLVCVPVRNKEKIIGVLEAVNRKNDRFQNEDMELLASLANHVAIALENAFLHEQNLAQLSEMIEEEKQHRIEKDRLLKDLHDGIGGITANINILSELARKSESVAEMKKALAVIAELSREGVAEIRSFMNGLENGEATWNDLAAELRRHGSCVTEPHNISFDIKTEVSRGDEKPGIFLYFMIFRICREALTNIIKHSRAKCVEINFIAGNAGVTLSVCDDGIGFKEETITGRGIANMRARAGELGGYLTIVSGPGTCVRFEMPGVSTITEVKGEHYSLQQRERG